MNSRLISKRFDSACLASALLLLSLNIQAAVLTGPTLNPGNGHTYYLLDSANWTDSQAEAITLGGNLVTINDQAENDWVFNTFSQFDNIDRALWIGYSDAGDEGNFSWVSGEANTFENWSGGQPDNGGGGSVEHYVHLLWPSHATNAGDWNDFQNLSSVNGFPVNGVVEINAIPIPPAALLFISAVVLLRRRLTF